MMSPDAQIDDELLDASALPRLISKHPQALWPFLIARAALGFSVYSGIRFGYVLFQNNSGQLYIFQDNSDIVFNSWWLLLIFLQIPGGWLADLIALQRKFLVWSGAGLATGLFLIGLPEHLFWYPGVAIAAISFTLYPTLLLAEFGKFYRGREPYRLSGVSAIIAAEIFGAAVAIICYSFFLRIFSPHQVFLILAVVLLLAHLFLILGARVYREAYVTNTFPETRQKSKTALFALLLFSVLCLLAIFSFRESQWLALSEETEWVGLRYTLDFLALLFSLLFLVGMSFAADRVRFTTLTMVGFGILVGLGILVLGLGTWTYLAGDFQNTALWQLFFLSSAFGALFATIYAPVLSWVLRVSEQNTCLAIAILAAIWSGGQLGLRRWMEDDPEIGGLILIPATVALTFAAVYLIGWSGLANAIKTKAVDKPSR